MNKILILGGGGHAKVIYNVLKKINQWDILGYCGLTSSDFDLPYLGSNTALASILQTYPDCHAVLGVGNVTISYKRESLLIMLETIGFKLPPLVSPDAVVARDVLLGDGTVVMDGVVIQPGTHIGKGCILNTHSSVDHDCEIENFVHIASGAILSGGAKIGSHTLVGAGACIVQYKTIASECLIGAGAVVTQDILEPGLYLGVPARKHDV